MKLFDRVIREKDQAILDEDVEKMIHQVHNREADPRDPLSAQARHRRDENQPVCPRAFALILGLTSAGLLQRLRRDLRRTRQL
ncbi:hypothetical protein C8Q80DRAFT_1208227 [Daedaleopsis nitida]|nr:hypothetical protein C8Q80DRAFT_1208227 [Daedaleopsis nitida]